MKTSDIIAEAARIVNVEPRRLSVLWCGQVIKPDVPIQVKNCIVMRHVITACRKRLLIDPLLTYTWYNSRGLTATALIAQLMVSTSVA